MKISQIMVLKKGWLILIVFLVLPLVNSMAGISPGSYSVNFEPGKTVEFDFYVIGDDNMKFKVELEGDMAQYGKVTPKLLKKPGMVKVIIKFPEKVDLPGSHILYVSSQQVPDRASGISLLANIKGVIAISVPYSDEFAVASLITQDTNAGQPVDIELLVENLGNNDFDAKASLDIIDPNNDKISNIPLGNKFIRSLESDKFITKLDTKGYMPGHYIANAIVNYGSGKIARANSTFRLGDYYVGIIGSFDLLERNRLNKLEITVESFWGDTLKDVSANVTIIGSDEIRFSTNKIDLSAFQIGNLTGYFDTTGIESDEFLANVTVYYGGKSTNKIIPLRFKQSPDFILYAAAGIVLLMLILVIFIILLFFFKRNKDKDGKKNIKITKVENKTKID
jgi:hypothetical protein